MMFFFGFILWIFFAAVFFFILYHVIYAAINAANNESKLGQDVREIKLMLAAWQAGQAEPAAQPQVDPALAEQCPGCGHRVHPDATSCPEYGLTLG